METSLRSFHLFRWVRIATDVAFEVHSSVVAAAKQNLKSKCTRACARSLKFAAMTALHSVPHDLTMHFGSNAFAFIVFVPFVETVVNDGALGTITNQNRIFFPLYISSYCDRRIATLRCAPQSNCNAKLKWNLPSHLCRRIHYYRLHFPWINFHANAWQ